MAFRLYNTLTRKVEDFRPITPGQARFYSCGPTVYNYAHIGNFRAFVCSDLLKRYLLFRGLRVRHIMNITDVDDKTIRGSRKEGKSLKEFTEFYTRAFMEDLESLNIMPADEFPKATESIPEMVALIRTLLDKGYAYRASDGIYFRISRFRDYGKLSGVRPEQLKDGARVCSDEYDKDSARDFALWKYWDESDGDVFWETEIGKGRPGWHIECSAMSGKALGQSFDLHSGGIDLVFPHHENEIAQSEAATGKRFVRHWFHNEYILVDGKKMSKSLGNFYTLRDVQEKGYANPAIRYLLISSHYRTQLNFSFEALDAAGNSVRRIQELHDNLRVASTGSDGGLGGPAEGKSEGSAAVSRAMAGFQECMDDDLNISGALAAVFEMAKELNRKRESRSLEPGEAAAALDAIGRLDSVLGILSWGAEDVPDEVAELVRRRESARAARDWKAADTLREKIAALGYSVDDTGSGTRIRKA